ncbi:MAG: barnase inhibitor [Caulobacter sp.]|nr:barnase inhibitor [Caulobacter sp.]
MRTKVVVIPTDLIRNWDTFHDVFARILGFPNFYGRNMNAWIDCLTSADAPEDAMTTQAVGPGELLTLQLNDAADFARRCPEQYEALLECTAFVNYRRVEVGEPPVLSLLLAGYFNQPH